MSNLVIVAIPDENDRVWKVSSEKVPHLTLLFLGDVEKVGNLQSIVQFVEHAAETTLRRFYLPVDRRGELGEDKADVLFFKKGRYDYKAVRDFRVQLLKDNNIRTTYDSTTQFEGPWTPHLTLGYPSKPAKSDDTDRDYDFYDVAFNRIAVWTDDYDGPEFLLKDPWDEWETLENFPMDVAMSDLRDVSPEDLQHYGMKAGEKHSLYDVELEHSSVEAGAEFLVHAGLMPPEEFLEAYGIVHYGVKGMRWGVRRQREVSTETHIDTGVIKRRTKVVTTGGEAQPAHDDAVAAAVQKQMIKKSGTAALSTKELRDLANRLQVENQVEILLSSKGKQFVAKQLEVEGKEALKRGAKRGAKKAAPHVIKKASKGAATVATTAVLL